MNTLLKKDLRENFKLALIGLAILSLIITMAYQDCLSGLKQLLSYGNGTNVSNLNPLLSNSFRALVTFFVLFMGLCWVGCRPGMRHIGICGLF